MYIKKGELVITEQRYNEGEGSAVLVDNVYTNTLLTGREGRETEGETLGLQSSQRVGAVQEIVHSSEAHLGEQPFNGPERMGK